MPVSEKILELKNRVSALKERIAKLKERRKNRKIPRVKPTDGPGTQLTQLIEELGIKVPPTCSCKSMAGKMDRNGIDWCRENVDNIVQVIRENSEFVSWASTITATVKSVPLVLKGKINLLHPIRSLVLIAIERFEQKAVT
jgi:hypothetical protein